MVYKVKNISDKQFSFEGLNLSVGEVSGELKPEVFQRLLALYWNTFLMPVEESEEELEGETVDIVKTEPDSVEVKPIEEKVVKKIRKKKEE